MQPPTLFYLQRSNRQFLMYSNMLRLYFTTTNTHIQFIASLPSDISVQKALPMILKKYKAIIDENHPARQYLLNVNTISHIARNNYCIGKEQIIGNVLRDNDQLQITVVQISRQEPEFKPNRVEEIEAQIEAAHVGYPFSKRQKLEQKKVEKAAQLKNEESRKNEQARSKWFEKKSQNQLKQSKKPAYSTSLATKALNKIKMWKVLQNLQASGPTVTAANNKNVIVLEDQSES